MLTFVVLKLRLVKLQINMESNATADGRLRGEVGGEKEQKIGRNGAGDQGLGAGGRWGR